MGRPHDSRIAYWDHEPGIPGGETPPSTAGGTPAATEARFKRRQMRVGCGFCPEIGMVFLWVFPRGGLLSRA